MAPSLKNENGIIGSEASSGPGPKIMAADTLTGEKVVNPAGETLGEITHIMLDIANGTIAYAVLSFGGFLGLGEKLFAVPWASLALDVEDKWFVLNIEKERLRQCARIFKGSLAINGKSNLGGRSARLLRSCCPFAAAVHIDRRRNPSHSRLESRQSPACSTAARDRSA